MILPIVKYGNPVLRQKGANISKVTPEIEQLVADMLETMHDANGVGLAAQQIGKALQLAVIDIPTDSERPSRLWLDGKEADVQSIMPLVLINPKVEITKKKEIDGEGCLSFPGIGGDISRGYRVTVEYQDLEMKKCKFEAGGLLGRAVQHEVDHLNGVLFIDKMSKEEREAQKDKIEAIRLAAE
ncbi:MAG: peptide deformylase [Verrucomicrobiales bacterium]|jgi:peptide deformylase|nr:peptide deformylase [Verrucomicrobiales bacterium]